MKLIEKLKKLIRESNPMYKKETLVEKFLKGKCTNIKQQLDFTFEFFPIEGDLKKELGLSEDEFQKLIESDDVYTTFKEILIDKAISKK